MNYKGIIIKESLQDLTILKDLKILSTKVEQVTESHKTPWLRQWTLHAVEIGEDDAQTIADKISAALDSKHDWYADFKNDKYHFIILGIRSLELIEINQRNTKKLKNMGLVWEFRIISSIFRLSFFLSPFLDLGVVAGT